MNDLIEQYYKQYHYPNTDELYRLLVADSHKITKKQVKEFLDKKDEEQILKQNKTPAASGHIVAMFPNSVWQLDIFILKKYEKYNKNYSDILCAVDVFSRKVYIEKMKNKEAQTVTDAFRSILKVADNIPQVLVSDTDSSFTSREFKKLIEKEKINNVFVPIGDHNSLGIIDRFARTLKQQLAKIFVITKKSNWVDYIDSIVHNYNNKPHSGIAYVKPNEAHEPDNIALISDLNYLKNLKNDTVSDLQIGDKVRVNIKGQFDKGSEPQFSNDVYTVKKVRGNTIYIDGDVKKKRNKLLKVDKNSKNLNQNIIKIAKKTRKTELQNKREDIKEENIRTSSRVKKARDILDI
jgi:hypothetical protein